MHENLKHTVIKYLTKKIKKYSHFQIVTTNNIKHFFRFHINWQFRELLATNTINVFRFHIIIKQCWHFQIVTGNNTTHFSRVHIKQYWHFQRVPSKLNYSKNVFQSSYHTILTLSECYYQTILTFLELISNGIHTFTELLPNNSKHFFESFNGHLNRQKILKEKIPE